MHVVTHSMKWTGIRKGSGDLGLHSPGGRVSPLPERTHRTITHPDILHTCVASVTSSIWLISLNVKQYQVGIKLCQAASGTGQVPWSRLKQPAQQTLCSYPTPAVHCLAENRPGNGRKTKDSKSVLRSWSAQWQLWLCGSGLWHGSEDAVTAPVGALAREKSLRINHPHGHTSLEATSLEMFLLFAVEQRWTKQQGSREQEGSQRVGVRDQVLPHLPQQQWLHHHQPFHKAHTL